MPVHADLHPLHHQRILAVSAGKVQDEQHAVLADGEQQLLVRYEGVIPSRNSSDNDRQVRSEPQVLRYEARGQSVRLQAPVPADEAGMERYARAPVLGLVAGGQPLEVRQDLEIPGHLDPDPGLHTAAAQQRNPCPTLMTLHSLTLLSR